MRVRLAIAASLFFILSVAATSHARSGNLWSERKQGTAPLAQVPDFSSLAEQVVPGVVSISVRQKAMTSSGNRMQDPFEYFHRFFGPGAPGNRPAPRGRERMNQGIGTGFVISKDGLILTNNHVIEKADSIEVTFASADGSERTLSAQVLGTAPEYDVALIKTDDNARAVVTYLGDSDSMRIGDWVMAVGNPFGLSHSVSVGIISAKERRDIAPSGRHGLYNFLQTDASINPGNSGGPLINMNGEVIGINTAINAAGSGIGFAIPINMVKEMLPDLEEKGRYARSWIGIRIQPMTPELAETYGLSKPEGALVSEVVEGGPAEDARLEDGDLIIEFNGKPVRSSSDLPLYASLAGVGKKVPLVVLRDGKRKRLKITLGEFPADGLASTQSPERDANSIGMTVSDITPELRDRFGLRLKNGVLLKEIEAGSPAARAGLRAGDVVLKINGQRVVKARDFVSRFKKLPAGKVVRLQIAREGSRLYLAIRKPK